MSSLSFFGRNLKALFSRELAEQLLEQEQKLDARFSEFEQRNDARASQYEQAFDERIIRQELAFDQRTDTYEAANNARMDNYERAVDQRLEERAKAIEQRLDQREAFLDLRLDGFENALTERLSAYEETLNEALATFTAALTQRQDEFEEITSNRLDAAENGTDTRLDTFETAITERLNERDLTVDQRFDERFSVVENRLDERFSAVETNLDERLSHQEKLVDDRFAQGQIQLDTRFDERFVALEKLADERTAKFELQLDQRFDERITAIEQRNDERLSALELRGDEHHTRLTQMLDARLAELTRSFELRFDERTHGLETRADSRLNALDKHLDDRFVRLEKTTDTRMEAHERLVDGKLKTNREDLVDRTDVMLQLFEQRLDEQRRAIRHLREQLLSKQPVQHTTAVSEPLPALENVLQEAPAQQVQSFRKLAEGYHPLPSHKLPKAETALYHRILDWKKVAHVGLNDFTPDEKEVVDYIMSFISDPAERHYVMQHMRRFLSTLERIPPPQSSTDRLLELGSLLHFVPALNKYTGYQIVGADYWESEEKVSTEVLQQLNGKDQLQVELSNFNVESDPFPYPDKHFRVVLCCELIEHLQRDPLHMLWECNRVLQDDGFLLLTTPNIASARSIEGLLITCSPYLLSQYNRETPVDQHNHEYAPYEVGVALAAAGFTVVELEAEDVWLRSNPAILELLQQVEISTDLRGDNIFALARKTSAPVERYPKELYVQ